MGWFKEDQVTPFLEQIGASKEQSEQLLYEIKAERGDENFIPSLAVVFKALEFLGKQNVELKKEIEKLNAQ